MLHLLPRRPAPDVHPAPAAESVPDTTLGSACPPSTSVLISEQQVMLSTAVATSAAPATVRRHLPGAKLLVAVRRIHIALPEPRPNYPRREASYFEAARMSRHMDHL